MRVKRSRGSVSDPQPAQPGDRVGRLSWGTSSEVESARIEGFVGEEEGEQGGKDGERPLRAGLAFMTRSAGADGVWVVLQCSVALYSCPSALCCRH